MKANFGKKGWIIIIFTLFIYMFTSTAADVLNITTDGFALRFGMDSGSSLLIFAAIGGFIGIPTSFIVGHIISKKGLKGPTVALFIILAVIWFLYGRCNTFGQYAVIATVIMALANCTNLVLTQQLMSNWFPKKKGIALGWATIGMPLDGALMIPVFQALIVRFDLAAPFYLMAVIFVILAVLMLLAIKEYPEQAGVYPDNEPITEEEKAANLALLANYKSEFTIKKLFATKDMWLLVITFGLMFIGLLGAMTQMIPRLTAIGMDINTAIAWLSVVSIISLPASVIWGIIDQKIGTKKTTVIFAALWTIMMFMSAISCHTINMPITIFSVLFLACMNGGLGNMMPSMIISVFGRYDFANANKLIVPFVVGIRTLAFLIMPMILGIAGANVAHGFFLAFIVFGILSLISFIASLFISKTTIGKIM